MQFPSHIWLNTFQSIMLGISDSSLLYHPINQTQMLTSVSYVNVLSFPYTHEKKLWSTELSKTVTLFYLHHYNYSESKTFTDQYFYNISRLCYSTNQQMHLFSNLNFSFKLVLALNFSAFQCLPSINTLTCGPPPKKRNICITIIAIRQLTGINIRVLDINVFTSFSKS